MTDARKRVFLETLRQTGSFAAASRAATPHSKVPSGGQMAWRDLMKKDPEFALAVEDARAEALGNLEAVAYDRAKNGWRRPVYQQGQLVGHDHVFDNGLLLRFLAKLDPDWSPKRDVTVSGQVEHAHTHAHVLATIGVQDLMHLPPRERETFLRLLERIADGRGEPPTIDAEPDAPALASPLASGDAEPAEGAFGEAGGLVDG